MSKKITDIEKRGLIILALLGGVANHAEVPRQVLKFARELYRRKYIRVWQYNDRNCYFLTDLGWRAVLRFCKPAKSDIYQTLRRVYKNYKQPKFEMGEEVHY